MNIFEFSSGLVASAMCNHLLFTTVLHIVNVFQHFFFCLLITDTLNDQTCSQMPSDELSVSSLLSVSIRLSSSVCMVLLIPMLVLCC